MRELSSSELQNVAGGYFFSSQNPMMAQHVAEFFGGIWGEDGSSGGEINYDYLDYLANQNTAWVEEEIGHYLDITNADIQAQNEAMVPAWEAAGYTVTTHENADGSISYDRSRPEIDPQTGQPIDRVIVWGYVPPPAENMMPGLLNLAQDRPDIFDDYMGAVREDVSLFNSRVYPEVPGPAGPDDTEGVIVKIYDPTQAGVIAGLSFGHVGVVYVDKYGHCQWGDLSGPRGVNGQQGHDGDDTAIFRRYSFDLPPGGLNADGSLSASGMNAIKNFAANDVWFDTFGGHSAAADLRTSSFEGTNRTGFTHALDKLEDAFNYNQANAFSQGRTDYALFDYNCQDAAAILAHSGGANESVWSVTPNAAWGAENSAGYNYGFDGI